MAYDFRKFVSAWGQTSDDSILNEAVPRAQNHLKCTAQDKYLHNEVTSREKKRTLFLAFILKWTGK